MTYSNDDAYDYGDPKRSDYVPRADYTVPVPADIEPLPDTETPVHPIAAFAVEHEVDGEESLAGWIVRGTMKPDVAARVVETGIRAMYAGVDGRILVKALAQSKHTVSDLWHPGIQPLDNALHGIDRKRGRDTFEGVLFDLRDVDIETIMEELS